MFLEIDIGSKEKMNKLVVFDSMYGNTGKIAEAIAKIISGKSISVGELKNTGLQNLDILIVGSPTQGGRPTSAIQEFLKSLEGGDLKGIKVAAFDTRISEEKSPFLLKMIIKHFGYAAPKISEMLESKGGNVIASSGGFIVRGKEGPLAPGELERATNWLNFS